MDNIIKYFTNSNKNGVFVFYDSWPNLNNAEKELLRRIEVSCNIANIDFLTITNNGIVNLKSHSLYNVNINEIDKKYKEDVKKQCRQRRYEAIIIILFKKK